VVVRKVSYLGIMRSLEMVRGTHPTKLNFTGSGCLKSSPSRV